MHKSKYLIMSSREPAGLEWEPALQGSVGICHTLRRAYEIALFLAGITEPTVNYRKSLDLVKKKGAVRIVSRKEHEASAIIVRTRIY
jgi:hypothetical protein